MRKIKLAMFITLDGVIQSPGGPEEDPANGFALGGWSVPYFDEAVGGFMGEVYDGPFDLLLGRRTYDLFASHWPRLAEEDLEGVDPGEVAFAKVLTDVHKYVVTSSAESLGWKNTVPVSGDIAARIGAIKASEGPDLIVQGSSELVPLLLSARLVDSIRLITSPVALGQGKRLFGGGTVPTAFKLTRSAASPSGVLFAAYDLDADLTVGTFALP